MMQAYDLWMILKGDRQHIRCAELLQLPGTESIRKALAITQAQNTYRYSDDPTSAAICVLNTYHTE